MIKPTIIQLLETVKEFKIENVGDRIEQEYYHVIKKSIYNYEAFWKLMVFPYRYDGEKYLNLELPKDHEAICIYNYSIFRNAIRIFKFQKEGEKQISEINGIETDLFEDWLIWLLSSFEKIRYFGCVTTKTLHERQILDDSVCKNIKAWLKHKNIFEKHYNDEFKRIETSIKELQEIRNYVIHIIKLSGFKNKIPNNKGIKQLGYWSDFQKYAIAHGEDDPENLLINRYKFLNGETINLFNIINSLWGKYTKFLKEQDLVIDENYLQRTIKTSISLSNRGVKSIDSNNIDYCLRLIGNDWHLSMTPMDLVADLNISLYGNSSLCYDPSVSGVVNPKHKSSINESANDISGDTKTKRTGI
jgi:hypothetical protein